MAITTAIDIRVYMAILAPIDMRIHGHCCCHRYAHTWPIDTRIHGHCCCHRYAHTWPIDMRMYGHSYPHRCAHTPIYGLYCYEHSWRILRAQRVLLGTKEITLAVPVQRAYCYDLGAGSTEPATRVTTVMIAVLAERSFIITLSSYTTIKDYRGLNIVSFYYINNVLFGR